VAGDLPPEVALCPDICRTSGWHFPHKNDAEKGFLYCCSYQSFKQSIPWTDFLDNPGLLAIPEG
jgi:hypothetical protein